MSNEYLRKLAEADLSNARDNLIRARRRLSTTNGDEKWGQSNSTLNEIIAGYERWEQQAISAVAATTPDKNVL